MLRKEKLDACLGGAALALGALKGVIFLCLALSFLLSSLDLLS
jgi:hypothetical protein